MAIVACSFDEYAPRRQMFLFGVFVNVLHEYAHYLSEADSWLDNNLATFDRITLDHFRPGFEETTAASSIEEVGFTRVETVLKGFALFP